MVISSDTGGVWSAAEYLVMAHAREIKSRSLLPGTPGREDESTTPAETDSPVQKYERFNNSGGRDEPLAVGRDLSPQFRARSCTAAGFHPEVDIRSAAARHVAPARIMFESHQVTGNSSPRGTHADVHRSLAASPSCLCQFCSSVSEAKLALCHFMACWEWSRTKLVHLGRAKPLRPSRQGAR